VFRDEATMKAGVEKLVSVKGRVANIGLRWTGSVFNLDMIRTLELEGWSIWHLPWPWAR